MLLSFVQPASALGAQAAKPPVEARNNENTSAEIEPLVQQEITQNGNTDFFIWMKEKADLSPAKALKTKADKGQFVFDALRATAERTQKDLRAYLDQQGAEYKAFYIANKILVRGGDENLLNTVAAMIRKATDGIAVIAHPFSAKGVFGPTGRNLFAAAASDWAFHAFEVYNSLPFLVWANAVAAKLAGGQGLATTGGSDAHVLEAVGKGYTVYRGTSTDDLRASIEKCETRAESARSGLSLAWRYAMRYPEIRRMHQLNAARCNGESDPVVL